MIIIGHRGASGYKPENTLQSFEAAINMGVDMIELDVHRLKTGQVIVFHDDSLERTTDGKGKISQLSHDDIQSVDAGNGQTIPLLSDVLDLIAGKVAINIELKGPDTAEPVAEIINRYVNTRGWRRQLFLVSSFDPVELEKFARLRPDINVSPLYRKLPPKSLRTIAGKKIFSTNLNARFITRGDIESLHADGIKVFAYTVNSGRAARRMLNIDVDGIFTDFPDKTAAELGKI